MNRVNLFLIFTLVLMFTLLANAEKNIQIETKDAFLCKLFIQKNTCWKNYEITTKIIDINASADKQLIGKIIIDKNKLNGSLIFKCSKGTLLSFQSSFNPPIFQEQKDKLFFTKKLWKVPSSIPKDAEVWVISLCFPDDFQKVPMPMGEVKNCKCVLTQPIINEKQETLMKKSHKNF